MVSNTSNRAELAARKLSQLGFDPALYDGGVLTSGECAYEWIRDQTLAQTLDQGLQGTALYTHHVHHHLLP